MKRILMFIPVHQKEDIFKVHLASLRDLIIPTWTTLDKLFVLHNCEELKDLLLPEERFQVVNDKVEYDVDGDTHIWKAKNLMYITNVKNQVAKLSVTEGYDYVFMVDSDLVLKPNTLLALLEADRDIVAELFWTKWTPEAEELPNVWDFDHYTFTEHPKDKYKENTVYKCGGTGACILISTEVYKAGVDYSPITNVSFWGEDRAFSIRAHVHGFTMYIDTHEEAFHIYRESDLERALEFYKETRL